MADWWNPSTWFNNDQSTGTAPENASTGVDQAALDEEEERQRRLKEAQAKLAAAKTQEEWQQIASEYSDLGGALGSMPSNLPPQADMQAKEALKQQLQGAKTQEEWQGFIQQAGNIDTSGITMPANLPTQAGVEEQAQIEKLQQSPYTTTVEQESEAGARNQYLAETNRKNDLFNQVQNMWESIATENEKFYARLEPRVNPIKPDMITDNPLELNLGGLRVQAADQKEMTEMLRFITDNRGYLPSGGIPLGGSGVMSFSQYKTAIENEEAQRNSDIGALKDQYDYWRVLTNRNAKYDDAVKHFEDNGFTVIGDKVMGPDGETVSNFRGINAAYYERVKLGYGQYIPDAKDKMTEAYTYYTQEVNDKYAPSWLFDDMEQNAFKTPFNWKVNKELNTYTDPNGNTYTAQQIINNSNLLKQFSDTVTDDMVNDFQKLAAANPEMIENLLFQIGDTPETRVLLQKAYPELKNSKVLDDYMGIIRKQRGGNTVQDKVQQIITEPKLPDGTPDPVAQQIAKPQDYDKWQEFLNIITVAPKEEGFQTRRDRELLTRIMSDTDIPDREKIVYTNLLNNAIKTSPEGIQDAFTNLWSLTERAFGSLVTNVTFTRGGQSYEEWNTPIFKDAGWLSFFTWKGVLEFLSPQNWIAPERLVMSGPEKVALKAVEQIASGKGKQAAVKAIEKEAAEAGVDAKELVDDAEKVVIKGIQDGLAPEEITLPERLVKPKPGAKIGDIVQTPEGPRQVERPVMRKADPNEPLSEGINPADVYTDPVTNQKYVPKTTKAETAKGATTEAGMPKPLYKEGEFITYQGDSVKTGELVNYGAFGDRGLLVGGTSKEAFVRPIKTKDGKLIGFKDPVNVKDTVRKIHEPVSLSSDEMKVLESAKKEFTKPEVAEIPSPTAKPAQAVERLQGKPKIEEINVQIEAKKQSLKQKFDEAFTEMHIISDPKERAKKEAEFYTELTDLAKLYVQKGYRTVEEFAREIGINVNEAVRTAWAEANGKLKVTGYDNLPDDIRKQLSEINVPEQQPIKEGFAGNIRLEKYGEGVQDIIKEWAEAHPGQIAFARRGIRSDAEVLAEGQRLAEEVGSGFYKKVQNWKPAQAWNAEEITALRGALSSKAQEIVDISKAITEGMDDTKNMLRLVTSLEEQATLQKALTGVTAEAGRALRSFRQTAFDSMKVNDTQRMEELLKRIGDKKDIQKVAEALSKLDISDPVAVNAFIRSITKPKATDYILEIFINSILSSPKTHLVNFTSNTLNAVLSPFERGVSALVERPLAAIQGRPPQRFFGEAAQDLFGLVRGIPEGVRSALYVLKNGFTIEQAGKWEMKTQAFTGKLGTAINVPTRALLAADQLGAAVNRAAALRAEAYRVASMEKLTGQKFLDRLNDLFANPTEDMLKAAHDRAEKRLFREEPGKITGAFLHVREKVPLGKYIIPFIRTPANLVKFGIERSPLGIVNPDVWKNVVAKDPAAAEQIANWLIGSTVATALTIYALDGNITGAPPISKAERDEFYRAGKQPFSLKIGNHWVSYQRMEPYNQMFSQVAAFVDAVNNVKNQGAIDKMAGEIAATIGSNFVSQTYMSGLADAIDAIEDPEHYAGNWFQRFATGFVPYSGLQRSIAQSLDTTIRQPSGIPQAIMASTPGLSKNVPARLNIYGEPDIRESSSFLPINISTVKNSPVDKALREADITPGFVGNSIKNIKLDETQHYEYQLLAGRILKEKLERAVDSKPNMDWSSEGGQAILNRAINTARDEARLQYLKILAERGIKPPKE